MKVDNRRGDERSDLILEHRTRHLGPASSSAEVSNATIRGIEMSEQDNKELVKKGYAAFSSGDLETIMSLFDDDVEWVQPGQSAVSGKRS